MIRDGIRVLDSPVMGAPPAGRARFFALDHLRAALVILVVLHHVALVYGASSPFYYVEPPFGDASAFRALLVFVLVNQAWFMGAFFLLAGYFTPASFDRKGSGAFLRDRVLRLGIPLAVYALVLNPIASLGTYLMPTELTGLTESPTWDTYPDLVGLGPMWFVALLLVFTFGYAAWRRLAVAPRQSTEGGSTRGYGWIAAFVAGLAVSEYLMRMVVPLGESVWEFPTLAYLPQYLGFFVVGVVASRRDWLERLSASTGMIGLASAVAAGVLLFPLAFSGQMFSLEISEALDNAMGNGRWQSAVYAAWDAVFSVGLILAALVFFRMFLNTKNRVGTFLSRHSYAVYVIHIPVVVYVAYLMRGVELDALIKFGAASAIILPACFAVAWVLRKIPLVDRIL